MDRFDVGRGGSSIVSFVGSVGPKMFNKRSQMSSRFEPVKKTESPATVLGRAPANNLIRLVLYSRGPDSEERTDPSQGSSLMSASNN